MVDYSFSNDEELFRESVRSFLQSNVAPIWAEIDERGRAGRELITSMGEQGFFAIPVSEEYGGQGGNFVFAAIAAEEVGYADPSMGLAVYTLLNNAWPFILSLYGSEDVKSEVLPRVGRGEAFFGIASTEPRGGSDVGGLMTIARRVEGGYEVEGEKIFISGVREVFEELDYGGWLLLARTGRVEDRHRGISAFAFIAKQDGAISDGVEYSILETIGRHGISTGMLKLNNAYIPDKALIGEVNRGFYIAMEGFNLARILVAAANIGTARWALERMIEWSRERRLFDDKPISSFQGVSFPIAEVAMEIEAARLLVYKAAWMADRIYFKREPGLKPRDLSFYSASAKLKAVETSVRAYETLMKTYGALSYVKETNVYRGMLGSLSYLVGAEGAQNIMKLIIAREVIGREYV
ncbi:MAG: acyl-CoA/acyl-ACP dehydrogenase [Desulfurococcales archaeon]|nr:acyl-CoA/acyl-ACP dehydrogenase [Desulfurococcales archaeon]